MSIASTPFLFLFLPIAIGIYFVLPSQRQLLLKNLFLIFISLFFYAWGEPFFVFLLLLLIFLTWALGRMASGGRKSTFKKTAVFLTVVMNVGVLLFFGKIKLILDSCSMLLGKDFSSLTMFPIGLTFFGFHSISYVVDIYRGQCNSSPRLFYAALYLSVFFKMLQGPIVSYREFEPQIENRTTTLEDFCSGIWRFAIGFSKKMIIAVNLAPVVKLIFSSDFSTLTLCDSWFGCLVYMIVIYFDFSGYSDMAIGLAKIFGFKIPENFNYPYISTSIGEYWRRWHITLCAWFRDYLFFPIALGPSVRFRKYLLRHNVNDQIARTAQNIFVPSCVWLVTALWHGTNWNYTIWGLINSSAMIIEPHLKTFKNKRIDTFVRWLGVMLILIFTAPLICTDSLHNASLYFNAMFGGTRVFSLSAPVQYYLKVYWIFLAFSAAGSFMFFSWLKNKLYPENNQLLQKLWHWTEAVFLMIAVIISLGFLFQTENVTFIYQQL